MDLSPKHTLAREAAQRLPALYASLALLERRTHYARILLYGTTRPAAGADPGGAPLLSVPLPADPGEVVAEAFQIHITTPIEGVVSGAGSSGTPALWARLFDGDGEWWSDASVSAVGAGGEIQLEDTLLQQGGICRLTSVIFQG